MAARLDLLLAGAVTTLGVSLAAGALWMSGDVGYDRIGPRAAPYGVALGLVLLGGTLAVSAPRRRADAAPNVASPVRWRAFGHLTLACLLFLALVGRTGFIVAASLQFWLIARAFSDTHPLRDAAVAGLLPLVVYVAFSRGLGLALPVGFAESLF